MSLPRINLVATLLCLTLLGGAYAERARRLRPADVEPYHTRAKAAVERLRYTIGLWTGVDVPVPAAAQQLLRPNALLSRRYINNTPSRPGSVASQIQERLSLLIVQCRDPRDMAGHYPPICYPAHGAVPTGERRISFVLTDSRGVPFDLHATEYRFTAEYAGVRISTVVINSLIIPGVGTTPDMAGVYRAAENYLHRLHGAAQIQIVLSDEIPPARRDEIYRQFFSAAADTLRDLIEPEVPATDPGDANQSHSKP